MTERRFQVARRLVKNKPWDFFMMVEMGPDRLHHVFWQYYDPTHPLYVPGNKYETAFQDYYRFLDDRGRLAARAASRRRHHDRHVRSRRAADDGRPVLQRLADQEGYLAMSETLSEPMPIEKAPIDWAARSPGATVATTAGAS